MCFCIIFPLFMFSMCLWDNLEVSFLPSQTQKELKSVPSPNLLYFLWTPYRTLRRLAPFTGTKHEGMKTEKVQGAFRNETGPCPLSYSSGYLRGSLMDGASILKLFKLFRILTLVLKRKNNAKINGFSKLLMWVSCLQISLKLRKSLI